jgi:hypothetical protein
MPPPARGVNAGIRARSADDVHFFAHDTTHRLLQHVLNRAKRFGQFLDRLATRFSHSSALPLPAMKLRAVIRHCDLVSRHG